MRQKRKRRKTLGDIDKEITGDKVKRKEIANRVVGDGVFGKFVRDQLDISFSEAPAYVPAMFFVSVGLVALAAPSLIHILLALTFLFIGMLLWFVAWKFVQLKRKFDGFMKQFDGKVMIQGLNLQDPLEFGEEKEKSEGKKIVYH